MADTEKKLEQAKTEFQNEQLNPVELFMTGSNGEFNLEAAKEIGFIEESTIDQINQLSPAFKKAFSKAKEKPNTSDAQALKAAFFAINMPILLKQNSSLESPDNPVMQELGKVLKYKIKDNIGLKGRTELEAAIKRIALLKASHNTSSTAKNSIPLFESTRDSMNSKLAEYENHKKPLQNASSILNELNFHLPTVIIKINNGTSKRNVLIEIFQTIKTLNGFDLPNMSELIEQYLNKLTKFYTQNHNDPPVNALSRFANTEYRLFLESAIRNVTELTAENDNSISNLNREISLLDSKIDSFRNYNPSVKTQDILTKAFGDVNSVVLNKAQMDVAESEKNVKTCKELQEYFLGNNLEKLETLYDKFENNLAGNLETSSNETTLDIESIQLEARISELEEKVKERMDSRDRKDRSGNYVSNDREAITNEQIIPAQKNIKRLRTIQKSAKEFHSFLLEFTEHLASLLKLEIIKPPQGPGLEDISEILNKVRSLDPESPNFTCKSLLAIVQNINPYHTVVENKEVIKTKFNEGLPKLENMVIEKKQKLNDLESKRKENKDLTDAQAAKKIITAMLAEQFPDMSLEDLQKVATMILAEDVATIQNSDNYEELAKKANAEVLGVAKVAMAREKLVGLRFKVEGKFVQPFKGFKPSDFATWESIENLFKIGKLNHQNGFLAFAALKKIEGDVPSIQTIKMEKKLKELIAKELGVEERMDEAGISRIIDKAFEEQLKKLMPLVEDFSTKFDGKKNEWSAFKKQEFENKFKILAEDRRLGKISDEIYQKRYNELTEEALEAGVDKKFGMAGNAVLASLANSTELQWLRDRGHDVGRWAKEKAKGLGMSGLRIGWRAGLGSAKLGTSLLWQSALMPFRILKYPLKLLGKPINLFRKTPWAPLAIRSSLRNDFSRVLGYSKEKGKGVWEGTKSAAGVIPQEWKARKSGMKKYSERTKIDNAKLKSEAEELNAKADEEVAVEVASIPYIKLDKYKSQIDQLNKIISRGVAEEAAA